MFHGWMFDPDGDQAAADSTRSSTTLDTGLSVNPRTARRLVTASYTSMIAYLPPAIAVPVMKHCGPEGSPVRPNRPEVDPELQHTRPNTTAVRERNRIVDERLTILGAHTKREPCLKIDQQQHASTGLYGLCLAFGFLLDL